MNTYLNREKLKKTLGNLTVEELDKMPEAELKQRIVQANAAMKEVQDELDNNEKYQEVKAQVAAMTQGKKDVDKRQKAMIKYCLGRMEEIGKDPALGAKLALDRLKELQEQKKKELETALNRDGITATVEVK